jgi:hypothetical protein
MRISLCESGLVYGPTCHSVVPVVARMCFEIPWETIIDDVEMFRLTVIRDAG